MIQYSNLEKEQAKAARKKFKQDKSFEQKQRLISIEEWHKRKEEYEKKKDTIIRTGILPSEKILEDNHPVYGDYLYVIDHEEGKIIRSNIYEGTVRDLKRSLYQDGYKFTNVYTCNLSARNLI